MAIETVTFKREHHSFPTIGHLKDGRYRYSTDCVNTFHSLCEYTYDGVLFLWGYFNKGMMCLINVETGAYAVASEELATRSSTFATAIDLFKGKVQKSGLTIQEVVRNFKSKNLDLPLWEVSSLIV